MKVAVYGTLKRGHGNHYLLEGSKHVKDTVLFGYDMYSLGGFPGIKPGEGKISAEIYEIDKATLQRLDGLEGYYQEDVSRSLYIRDTLEDGTYIYIFNRSVVGRNEVEPDAHGVQTW